MTLLKFFLTFLFVPIGLMAALDQSAVAQSISIVDGPTTLQPGSSYNITVNYSSPEDGIVQLQVFESDGTKIDDDWTVISAGSDSEEFTIVIPGNTAESVGCYWQAIVYDVDWGGIAQQYIYDVSVVNSASEPTINFSTAPPSTVTQGQTVTVDVDFDLIEDGFVQVQLVSSGWVSQANDWTSVTVGESNASLTMTVPANTPVSNDYRWQAIVYDSGWNNDAQQIINNITVGSGGGNGDTFTLDSSWGMVWNDEFDTDLANWFPFLGYNSDEHDAYTEFPLRWAGATPDTAWMYSMKQGRHRLGNEDGETVLELDATCINPGQSNWKVETAYLSTGRPLFWGPNGSGPVWGGGKFVNANDTELYISTRVKTNKVVGWSTWFAFWLHSPKYAYNDNPADGTEFDLIEIPKGQPTYMETAFNVANHWRLEEYDDNGNVVVPAGTESKQFNNASDPTDLSLVDVREDAWHTYGVHWKVDPNNLNDPSKTFMKCYVDGKHYYTFTDNLPTDPVDMMMFLTMEFKKDQWDGNQGDGRINGPAVATNGNERVMSRAFVDYVRIHEKN